MLITELNSCIILLKQIALINSLVTENAFICTLETSKSDLTLDMIFAGILTKQHIGCIEDDVSVVINQAEALQCSQRVRYGYS